MTHRARIAVATILLCVFVGILAVCVHRDTGPEPAAQVPSILRHDSGGLRFTYHVPSGTEGLFDIASDPKMLTNLARSRPADAARLREELRKKIGVGSLEELRRAQQDVIDRLHGLGYF